MENNQKQFINEWTDSLEDINNELVEEDENLFANVETLQIAQTMNEMHFEEPDKTLYYGGEN